MLNTDEIYNRLNSGYYKTKLPYVSPKQDPEAYRACCKDEARLEDLFREEALEAVGLKDHPKASKVWSLAWEYGHSAGLSEVFGYLTSLADLAL